MGELEGREMLGVAVLMVQAVSLVRGHGNMVIPFTWHDKEMLGMEKKNVGCVKMTGQRFMAAMFVRTNGSPTTPISQERPLSQKTCWAQEVMAGIRGMLLVLLLFTVLVELMEEILMAVNLGGRKSMETAVQETDVEGLLLVLMRRILTGLKQ